jgi:hypothetical protein
LGLLSTSLIFTVILGVLYGIAMIGGFSPVFIVGLIVFIVRIIGLSLGLAGVTQQKAPLLLGFFIVEVLFISTLVLLVVISTIIAATQTTGVGYAIWSGLLIMCGGYYIPIVVSSALALAHQTRLNYERFETDTPVPCAHSADNNKTALIGLLSFHLVVCLFVTISTVVMGFNFVASLPIFIPQFISLVASVVGIVAVTAKLASAVRAKMLLAFFIIQILVILTVFGIQIAGIAYAIANSAGSGIEGAVALVISLVIMALFYLIGPAMVYAWQTRLALLSSSATYVPLEQSAAFYN